MKKHTLILWLFCLLSLTGKGQDFTQLDWHRLRIDSVLPTYVETVPLETDYRLYDYSVRVLYPEWQPLTATETAVARRFLGQLADSLQIETFVGASRGQGMLDLRFIPVICRNDKFLKLLSGKVEIIPTPKKAATATRRALAPARAATREQRWASKSVLATGKWAKVTVKEDGLYRLTTSTLRSMGFTRTQNVKVYGYGGHRQNEAIDADADWDDLEPVALLPVGDGYVFFANGLETWRNGNRVLNHYARAAAYFVTENDEATEAMKTLDNAAEVAALDSAAKTITNFTAHASYDPQEYAWFQGGSQLYENYDYINGNSRNYTLTLPSHPADGQKASLAVCFSALAADETTVTPTYNGSALTPFTISSIAEYNAAMQETKKFSGLDTPTASTTVRLSATNGHNARLNYLELTYTGDLRISAQHPVIHFEISSTGQTTGTGGWLLLRHDASQQPRLWRLGEPGQPAVELKGTDGQEEGQHIYRVPLLDDGTAHRYVAFDAGILSALPEPTSAGSVENQNLHATDSLDMVIITPASGIFDTQAKRLAEAHQALDGMRVGIFRADHIYNEFSSGTPDATAYRRFLKMLYDRGRDRGTAPRYLLLFGDCAWDNRMMTSTWRAYDPKDFLLCFESVNSLSDTQCYVMEDYFGLLDDGEGRYLTRDKTDLGIGRFPVRTQAEAQHLVDKTISYMRSEQAGAWKNVVVFMGDDGDLDDHLIKADDVAEVVVTRHPELEVRKVMWDAYQVENTASGARYPQIAQLIKEQMEEGALMMNYTGHGSTYCISHEMVLRTEDFANFSSPRLPLWVTAACDIMPFDTQKENIGETAILHQTGSAVAFYGTTRTVYAGDNLTTNKIFCRTLFDTDEQGRPNRLGDAVRVSKGTVTGHAENRLHYALLGDPALRIGSADAKVVLDSINGKAVNELDEDFTLNAGARARFSGHVQNADGQALNDFNGTLSLRLYDSQNTITCLNNDGKDTPFTYTAYDRILYNGQDSVSAGRFTLTCPIPLDIQYSDTAGRLLFYAISNDRLNEANGYSHDFLLGGTAPELSDNKGPKLTAYLGSESFTDGSTVCSTPYFVAHIEDESGISTSGTSIGHDLELIVDNDPSQTYNLNSYFVGEFGDFSRGTVAFSLPALSDGEHTLCFRAWDTLNNPSSVTLHFRVDAALDMNILSLSATQSPATTQTTFVLRYDRPGSTCDFTFEVFDFTGRLLWNHSASGANASGIYTVTWNLSTGTGFPLGSGVYLYRARVRSGESEEVSKTQKIIIKRNKQ